MIMTANNKIFFVRHGKLSLPFKDHSVIPFSVLATLGRNELEPPIDMEVTKSFAESFLKLVPQDEITKIFSSPSKRCQETATMIKDLLCKTEQRNIEIITVPEIREVFFDLDGLAKSFNYSSSQGIDGVNTLVFQGMLAGKQAETFSDSFKRVTKFFDILKQEKVGTYIVVTHDFIMRVIEIFIKNKGQVTISIGLETLEGTKRNTYVRGFETDMENLSFSPIT
jgi:broad specificity phosphatase PhoE